MTDELGQLVKAVGIGLSLMLPLANPLTSMSLLLSLGSSLTAQERAKQIKQATFYVVAIMLVTYYAGLWIMNAFEISMPGMRIAGGLVVAFIGFNMLFPSTSVSDIPEADHAKATITKQQPPSIAFVPLALPGTAGPGTMAMIISTSSKVDSVRLQYVEWVIWLAPLMIAVLLGALFFVCLRSADRLVKIIGHDGIDAVSRVMGFLLVCMGVQLVINGVQELARAWP
jgi:multiple antibiotic resistance protein